jgi:hypothetical protein
MHAADLLGLAPSASQTYLGPGEVTHLEPLQARPDGGEPVAVEAAFPFPYRPALGDRLLLTGQGERYFAIGVLAGSGQASLELPGDVELRALGGTLTLEGDQGLELRSREITLNAGLLRTFADSLCERADSAYRWIKGTLTVRAGESRRVVEGVDSSRCGESKTLAEGTVKIDGHQVHLGQ